jgi:hypothetical protein
LRGLLEGEEQRQFALVYVTAFLESSLMGRKDLFPLFRDHRVAAGWLPKTMYITQFQESSFRPLATFEEDIDVTSGSVSGVRIRGDSLATWKENVLPFRSRTGQSSSTQENQAVWIGWNNRIAGEDTTRLGPPAAFVLELPDGLSGEWGLGPHATLDLMLTALDDTPGPRKDPDEQEKSEEEEAAEGSEAETGPGRGRGRGRGLRRFFSGLFSFLSPEDDGDDDKVKPPLRLSVQVVDADGNTGRVLLNRYGPVRRPIEIRIQRRKDQRYAGNTEMVLQSFSIPLADFHDPGSNRLDLRRLKEVRLLFDESKAGTVVLDQVGFSFMDPAFLEVTASG